MVIRRFHRKIDAPCGWITDSMKAVRWCGRTSQWRGLRESASPANFAGISSAPFNRTLELTDGGADFSVRQYGKHGMGSWNIPLPEDVMPDIPVKASGSKT